MMMSEKVAQIGGDERHITFWMEYLKGRDLASLEDNIVRFEVLTAVTPKITLFGDVTLCSLVEVYWHNCSALNILKNILHSY
jgi:hypothetical protein